MDAQTTAAMVAQIMNNLQAAQIPAPAVQQPQGVHFQQQQAHYRHVYNNNLYVEPAHMTVREYTMPNINSIRNSIRTPVIAANNFEIKLL
jgi:hypothetical protein